MEFLEKLAVETKRLNERQERHIAGAFAPFMGGSGDSQPPTLGSPDIISRLTSDEFSNDLVAGEMITMLAMTIKGETDVVPRFSQLYKEAYQCNHSGPADVALEAVKNCLNENQKRDLDKRIEEIRLRTKPRGID